MVNKVDDAREPFENRFQKIKQDWFKTDLKTDQGGLVT